MNLPLFVKRIIFGGSSRLAATELTVLDAVRAKLSPEESAVVEEQVQDIETVQKHADRVVTISYRQDAQANLLGGDEFCLAKLRLEEDGRKSSVTVWVFDGRLKSIEYTRRPKNSFSILASEIRPTKAVSTAAVIDRLEHPHETEG